MGRFAVNIISCFKASFWSQYVILTSWLSSVDQAPIIQRLFIANFFCEIKNTVPSVLPGASTDQIHDFVQFCELFQLKSLSLDAPNIFQHLWMFRLFEIHLLNLIHIRKKGAYVRYILSNLAQVFSSFKPYKQIVLFTP